MKRTLLRVTPLLLLLLLAVPLVAQNQMQMIMTISQEAWYDRFGTKLAALDFNGDGWDDLAVLQAGWLPDSVQAVTPYDYNFGRLLVYYGGPGFDNVPDWVVEGTYHWEFYTFNFYNFGDVNGDGFDDLGISQYVPHAVTVYFGGVNPSTQPGYYQELDESHLDTFYVGPLGDINGDGYDDFYYLTVPEQLSVNQPTGMLRIVLGGSFNEIHFADTYPECSSRLDGLGDINADGYDDYLYTYEHPYVQNTHDAILYYGGDPLFPADTLTLALNLPLYAGYFGKELGDLNNDGYDDFVGLRIAEMHAWLGSDTITTQYDFNLMPMAYCGGPSDESLVHGDLNGDGFEDVIGAYTGWSWWDGRACIWLGGANMNGTADYYFGPVRYIGYQFGIGLACGDFNGDGYDDVAAAESYGQGIPSNPGRVYIYAGNAQLADTTVAIGDELLPSPAAENWDFRAIPNPAKQGVSLKLRFAGIGYDRHPNLEAQIFNLRGQLLKRQTLNSAELKNGECRLDNLELSKGIYIIALYENGIKLKTHKCTIK